jgi:hypothetical protein
MDALIGGTRADILRILEVHMTTSEIATGLHLTPAAVSHSWASCVAPASSMPTRQGRGVYSALTAHGRTLLDLLGR